MKNFINLSIFVIVVLAALGLSVMTAMADEMNKGSTSLNQVQKEVYQQTDFDVLALTEVSNSSMSPVLRTAIYASTIEQGMMKDISPHSTGMIITNAQMLQIVQWRTGMTNQITQMQSKETAQWNYKNFSTMLLTTYGCLNALTEVPRVFPNSGINELSIVHNDLAASCVELVSITPRPSMEVPRVWPNFMNSSTSYFDSKGPTTVWKKPISGSNFNFATARPVSVLN